MHFKYLVIFAFAVSLLLNLKLLSRELLPPVPEALIPPPFSPSTSSSSSSSPSPSSSSSSQFQSSSPSPSSSSHPPPETPEDDNNNNNNNNNEPYTKFKSAYDYSRLKLPEGMAKCIAEEEEVEEKTFPLFSIVVTSSLEHVTGNDGDFEAATANLRCYTKLHDASFYSNLIDNKMIKESSHFFGKRWQAVLDRYISSPVSKWVFQVDADTVIANLSKPIDQYLDTPAEVVLHFRRNLEVTAAMVGFRAASPFARCFIKEWIKYGATGSNWDNGDLLQLLMDIIDPAIANHCRAQRYTLPSFIECFSSLAPQLRVIHDRYPIKVYFPLSGLWRSLECWVGEEKDPYLFRHCVDDDLFVHGWKAIGAKHITPDIYKCARNNPAVQGPLRRCHWKNAEDTLEFAKRCCYDSYKGCNVSNTNICSTNNPTCNLKGGVPIGYYDCKYKHIDCPDLPY